MKKSRVEKSRDEKGRRMPDVHGRGPVWLELNGYPGQ